MSADTRAAPPALDLPKQPMFMVLDGKTYFMEQMQQSPEDLLKHVMDFYKDNLDVLRDKIDNYISDESLADLDRQIVRVERHLRANLVTIPEALKANGTIMCYSSTNKVYETRIILFKPSRISVTMSRVREYVRWVKRDIPRKEAERYTKFLEWADPMLAHFDGLKADTSGIKIDIIIDQDLFVHAMVASYLVDQEFIIVSPRDIHPHTHRGGGGLCTGNSSARSFWDDPNFEQNFNSLNPHSWANGDTTVANNVQSLLKNQYFVEAHVRGEEKTGWKVS